MPVNLWGWRPMGGWPIVILLPLGLCAAPACAQTGTEATPPPANATVATTDTLRFGLTVRAPDEAKALLQNNLSLRRYQRQDDLSEAELDRLLELAVDDIAQLLGTQGWFTPVVRLRREASGNHPMGEVIADIEPGPPSRIASVDIYTSGAVASDSAATDALKQQWALPVGERFTQAGWDRAKGEALRRLSAQRYPAARIGNSLADVDPNTQEVRLSIEIDSGVAVTLGPVTVEGAERYDTAPALNLLGISGVKPGAEYRLSDVQDAQRRLMETGWYESVFVSVEPSESGADSPVRVQLREAKRQRLMLGVGASRDKGPRLTLEHRHWRLPGVGGELLTKGELQRDERHWSEQWRSRPDAQGWRWVAQWDWSRLDTQELQIVGNGLRVGQTQDLGTWQRSLFVQANRDRSVEGGVLRRDSAVSANYAWTRRRFDQEPYPNQGHAFGAELGAGTTLGDTRHPFVKLRTRWLGYWPLGAQGRMALRGDAGALWAAPSAEVPATERFLLGGDSSVRGYAPRSIGVANSAGTVNPGRYQAAGGVEWQRPLTWGDGRSWEHTLFVDAGAVANQPSELRAHWGVGTGVRFNSPVGPLQADLAYGLTPRRWRMHLRVGFVF
jgi:translocation and assembly module TamA